MLTRVVVVAERNQHQLENAVRDAWQSFEASIPNHPLINVPIEHHPPYEHGIDSIAMAVPLLNQTRDEVESGMIVFGDRFWSAELSADDRALTLLHESIHLRVSDTMCARTVRSDVLRRQLSVAEELAFRTEAADVAVYKQRRAVAGFQFHLLPEEAWAELQVRDNYPEWLERRLVALQRMREGNRDRAGRLLASIPQPLHPYWMIYELMRLDLMVALEGDHQRLARLAALKLEWSRDLFQLCPLDRLEVALRNFTEAFPRPLEADTISEARFDEYCDAVLAIPPL